VQITELRLRGTMLVSKLLDGVVVVERGSSRRAFRPKFMHRIMLAWVFRYFASLPMSVLTSWQKALIAEVMARAGTTPLPNRDSGSIIGTVESVTTPPIQRKPSATSTDWECFPPRAAGNRVSA
jgi:hypothetical protein